MSKDNGFIHNQYILKYLEATADGFIEKEEPFNLATRPENLDEKTLLYILEREVSDNGKKIICNLTYRRVKKT